METSRALDVPNSVSYCGWLLRRAWCSRSRSDRFASSYDIHCFTQDR